MIRALYPGTFDPLTRGHEDLVRRASTLFDSVILGIADSRAKKPFFVLEERLEIARLTVDQRARASNGESTTIELRLPPADLARVKATGVLNAALIARLYGVAESDVLFTPYGPGYAFKATIPRLKSAGDIGDTDVYGAQQHAPLLDVDIPI